ncbi:phosphatase PAP2 family protein [Actinopolymorpha rutila]|uniref:Membrane-associated phospholipid phosphatase n=1 Tax=Actinopolymorpha rutila TaxID=446787 RepID=A0A852ZEZ5_9ACTN|nr:membrane-associated phospholipid phosphatase [Actinopolymorpha rutila]
MAVVELVGLAAWFVVFTRLHSLAGRDVAAATRNAVGLQSLERATHLDLELTVNQWLTQESALIQPSVYFYRLYYVALIGVLAWTALRHSDIYPQLRRALVAMTALVLPVWWALPMSPPRFALDGVVDIIGENDLLGSKASTTLDNGQNHFSAMPSMHVALAAWCAFAVWSALRGAHPRGALLAWLFPVLMVVVVITTGNHYVLDVAGSAALLAVALAAAAVWARVLRRSRSLPPGPGQPWAMSTKRE